MKAEIWNARWWIDTTDPDWLRVYFKDVLIRCGFNILSTTEHYFDPIGWTALFLLSESHFAIHTFPEEHRTYLEISSCVESYFSKFINEMLAVGFAEQIKN